MVAQILDGKYYSGVLLDRLAVHIDSFKQDIPPGLAVVQVGSIEASSIYIRHKIKACKRVGIVTLVKNFASITEQDLLLEIKKLNLDSRVHGILVQLPLPVDIDEQVILDAIDPTKDVDGFHPYNAGLLMQKRPSLESCTPMGIRLLLEHYGCDLSGLDTVVVGASNIVGRPAALNCLLKQSTVTICHSKTRDLSSHIRRAECLIVAVGNPKVVAVGDIRDGAIVVDVGINRSAAGKIIGDIDYKEACKKASWITPVPGGVGPMTVACLMLNTWKAYHQQLGLGKASSFVA